MIFVNVYAFAIGLILVGLHGTDCFSVPTLMGRSNNNQISLLTITTLVNEENTFLQRANSGSRYLGRTDSLLRSKLPATAAEDENTEEETEEDAAEEVELLDNKKLAGRKKRLIMGYQLSSFAYLAASSFHLIKGGNNFLYYIFGGGTFTVAGILYILKGAAQNDRLGSDTYKRLNLSIIFYAFVQQILPAMGLGLSGKLFFKGPAILTLINGIKVSKIHKNRMHIDCDVIFFFSVQSLSTFSLQNKLTGKLLNKQGYGYGCLGWDKAKGMNTVFSDLKEGILSTLQGLTVVKAKSAGYILGTVMLGMMSLVKAKELCTMLFVPSIVSPTTYYQIFSRLSRLSRLGLMTTILYTLKDASDRDRLKGSTFIQLNFLAAAALLSMVLYLSPSIGKSNGPTTALVMLASGISTMTLCQGVSSLKAKNNSEQ